MYNTRTQSSNMEAKPLVVDVLVEGVDIPMEIDTGASVSIVSEKTFKTHWPSLTLSRSSVKLKTYSGVLLEVLGSRDVKVKYKNQEALVPLLVVKGIGPSLLG